jgi:hypothetical protein
MNRQVNPGKTRSSISAPGKKGRGIKEQRDSEIRISFYRLRMFFDFEPLEFLAQSCGIDREQLGGFLLVPIRFL